MHHNPIQAAAESPAQTYPSVPTVTAAAAMDEAPKPTTAVGQRRRNPILSTPVGSELHGCIVTDDDVYLEKQILDCTSQASMCEKLSRTMSALQWTRAMQAAIAARRPEIVAAWEAAEREWLDSLTYFDSPVSHGGDI